MSNAIICHLNFLLITCLFVILINATLSPPSKSRSNKNELKIKVGPQVKNVYTKNLVTEEPSVNDILIENGAYFEDTETRLFNGTVLAYLTPWNRNGYHTAKTWSKKFDIVSPVWLQILPLSLGEYELGGLSDIDGDWMTDIRRSAKHEIKILPRLLFDKFSDGHYSKLLTYPDEQRKVTKLIHDACKKYNFDGIVLEVWSELAARVDDEYLIKFVTEIAQVLKQHNLDSVLVVPPQRKGAYNLFSSTHFETLYPHFIGFSLMTYDFSNIQRPGANAPLYWMKQAVENICPTSLKNYLHMRSKIFLGLNLYGNDYTPEGGGPIIGTQFLDLLKHAKGRLAFDDHDKENYFEIKTPTGRHIVFYPTLYSINERIKLAQELGVGISLWEIGQGLDYFYDMF